MDNTYQDAFRKAVYEHLKREDKLYYWDKFKHTLSFPSIPEAPLNIHNPMDDIKEQFEMFQRYIRDAEVQFRESK